MTDIVERIRAWPNGPDGDSNVDIGKLLNEVDAEIVRLRAALQPFSYEYQMLMLQQDGFPSWHSVKTRNLLEAHRALAAKDTTT